MQVSTDITEGKQGEPYSLNGISLLLGDGNSLGARGERNIIVSIFTQQLKELVWVRGNQLRQLRVASAELLQDRLQHLRLLLNNLAELLKLGVVSEEVEVAQIATLAAGNGRGGGSSRSSLVAAS
jgi:hypothetical protein